MNRLIILACFALACIGGCSSPADVVLVDGSVLHSLEKPDFDSHSGFYKIIQGNGRVLKVNKDFVKSIKGD